MHIKSNTNLEKYIKNYRENYFVESQEIKIIFRIGMVLITTMFGNFITLSINYLMFYLTNIKFNELIKPFWPLIITGFGITGIALQHYLIKSAEKQFEKAKKNLTSITHALIRKDIIIAEETLVDAKITKETTKHFTMNNFTKTTTKRFYFLDNKEQIRILKEVKQTILNLDAQRKITTTDLYYEDVQNEADLPVQKTLNLKF